ncbi:hypothetical protein M3Y98_00391100 [Aphelenchoides besseyi]|nr:hypothetical protein M3Y98_00391100 [Aphelenchoides besseyi]
MNGSSQKAPVETLVFHIVTAVKTTIMARKKDELGGGNDDQKGQSVVNGAGDGMQNEKPKVQNICRWYPQRQFINTQFYINRDDRYKTAICKLWQTNNYNQWAAFVLNSHNWVVARTALFVNIVMFNAKSDNRRKTAKKIAPAESQAVNSTAVQWNNDVQLNLQIPTPDSGFYTSPSPAQWTGNWFPNAPTQWPPNIFAYPPPQPFCPTYDPYFMGQMQPQAFYPHIPLPDSLPLSPPAPILNYPPL